MTLLYIYATCVKKLSSSKLLAGKPFEYHEYVVMLINMSVYREVNVNNLEQTIVQHSAFQEKINSILTTFNQEHSTNIALIVSAEILQSEGSISTSSICGQLPNY